LLNEDESNYEDFEDDEDVDDIVQFDGGIQDVEECDFHDRVSVYARRCFGLFRALTSEGFSAPQAMRLVNTWFKDSMDLTYRGE